MTVFVYITNTLGAKTAPFDFCNNFVKTFFIEKSYWQIYTPVNLKQNDIKIISLSWSIYIHSAF